MHLTEKTLWRLETAHDEANLTLAGKRRRHDATEVVVIPQHEKLAVKRNMDLATTGSHGGTYSRLFPSPGHRSPTVRLVDATYARRPPQLALGIYSWIITSPEVATSYVFSPGGSGTDHELRSFM